MWRAQAAELRAAGVDTPDLDARLIVAHVLGLDTTGLIVGEKDNVPAEILAAIVALVARRASGEPVARLLGVQEFYGLRFALGPDTLVPRPETELLVELAEKHLSGMTAPVGLDLGTGTGCIPIALLHGHPSLQMQATDLSEGALEIAKRNAKTHGVAPRLLLSSGSWYAPLGDDARYDLITSNPPYIVSDVIPTLSPEVRDHDPALALDGGTDGLDAYRQIVSGAPAHLRPGGALVLEIGFDQAKAVRLMCEKSGLLEVEVYRDLAGHERVVVARH